MCADICFHDKNDGNPHAHIMLTMRPFEPDGNWGAKAHKVNSKKIPTVDWNEQTKAEQWRQSWATAVNAALESQNLETRINHRSYARQGKEKIPTVHLGVAAFQMERRGIRTERGDMNREIEITNKQIRQLQARINKLKDWLKTEATNTAPPTLTEVISGILNHENGASNYAKIRDLKAAAAVLSFLTSNHILDMTGLTDKINDINRQFNGVRDKLKKVERRLKTLDEHISHSENFKNYRGYKAQYAKLYAQYETLKKASGFGTERKAQKALEAANEYQEIHRAEIAQYETAERYLRNVLQGRFDPAKLPPITKWKEERTTKSTEQKTLYADYYRLRDEVKNSETIKRTVEQRTRGDEPKQEQRKRSYEMGL
jgi:uncharacterized phage infection (PIP) family protein YhgE